MIDKKVILFTIILSAILSVVSYGQIRDNAHRLSLGTLYRELSSIEESFEEKLYYKECAAFDFKKFKATIRSGATIDKYQLGYNNSNELREIVIALAGDSTKLVKFIIRDFPSHRILICKRNSGPGGSFMFCPSVIVLEKEHLKEPLFFMLTLCPMSSLNILMRMDSNRFPLGKFEDISAIMFLRDDLNANKLIKLKKSQIVFVSEIFYTMFPRTVDHENAKIYFCDNITSGLKLDESTYVDEINYVKAQPDLEVTLRVRQSEVSKKWPLWIFNGAHDYLEVER
jgi:hypothetical protein